VFDNFLRVVLDRPTWATEQILSELDKLTLDDVVDFANNTLLDKLNVNCMAFGSTNTTMVCLRNIL